MADKRSARRSCHCDGLHTLPGYASIPHADFERGCRWLPLVFGIFFAAVFAVIVIGG